MAHASARPGDSTRARAVLKVGDVVTQRGMPVSLTNAALVPANRTTESDRIGSPAPTGAAAMVRFVRSSGGFDPRGGTVEAGVEGTAITLGEVGVHGQMVTGFKGYMVTPSQGACTGGCLFDRANATLQEAGSAGRVGSDGINWGRWAGGYTYQENGSAVETTGDLPFVYSQDLSSPNAIEAQHVTATFKYAGGPAPRDELGNPGRVLNSTEVQVDFSSQAVTKYNLHVEVPRSKRAWSASLDGRSVGFSSAFRTDDAIKLKGTCTGSGCVNDGVKWDASGNASLRFVGNDVNRAMSSFELRDSRAGTGISGVMALDRK